MDIPHNHGAGTDDGASADRNPRPHESIGADPGIRSDTDRRLQQGTSRVGKVMRAGTQMRACETVARSQMLIGPSA